MPFTGRATPSIADGGTWVGYYTTRIYLKRFYQVYSKLVRDYSNLLLTSISHLLESDLLLPRPISSVIDRDAQTKDRIKRNVINNYLYELQEAQWWIGVLTHHDAITGTSTNQVAKDYKANCIKHLNNLAYNLVRLLVGF